MPDARSPMPEFSCGLTGDWGLGTGDSSATPDWPGSGGLNPMPAVGVHPPTPSYEALPAGAVARIQPSPRRSSARSMRMLSGSGSVLSISHRHFEQMGHRDGLGRTGFNTQAAEDAAKHVDLVHEAEALPRADRIVDRVVGAADVDATGRAHTGAEFAADALLHAVRVPVDRKPRNRIEEAHQRVTPFMTTVPRMNGMPAPA